MEETLRQLLALYATRFERITGVRRSVFCRRALDDSRYLDRVLGGDGFTVRTFDRLIAYLSHHWPDGHEWPDGTPRPHPSVWTRLKAEADARSASRRAPAPAPAEAAA